MNKNKKWYSLFLVAIILLSTIIQPIQAVASVVNAEPGENVLNINNTEDTSTEEPAAIEMTQGTAESTESSEITPPSAPSSDSSSEPSSSTVESTSVELSTESTSTDSSTESSTQSTTEESSVDKDKLQKVRALDARPAINILDLLNDGEKFITKVEKTVKDNGKEVVDLANTVLSPNATIGLNYDFKIPQELINEKKIKAGDYVEFNIPSQLKTKNAFGDLVGDEGTFGTYEFMESGKIRLVFNDNVEKFNDISGNFFYSESLKDTVIVGENIIKIPVGTHEEEVTINIRPNGGQAIKKSGKVGVDNKSITWDVSINTNMAQLTNTKVLDAMPDTLEVKGIKVYEQLVNIKGEAIGLGKELTEGTDYARDGNNVVFTGEYASTNKSFKVVYETAVKEDTIPTAGGTVDYTNQVTLKHDEGSTSDSSTVPIKYGMLLEKFPAKKTGKPGQVYEWTVKYNFGNKDLKPGSYILDKLETANLEYDQDPSTLEVTPVIGDPLLAGTDYVVEFIGKNEMKISFPKGLNKAVTITYETKVPFIVDDGLESADLKNTVTTDGATSSGTGQIARDGVVKNAAIDYKDRMIDWTIEVNRYKNDMKNWELIDTMSDGLTFDKANANFVIKSDDDSPLTLDKDYEFVSEGTNAKGFHIKFIGDLATTGTNKTYTITYRTSFNRYQKEFTNVANTKWKDSNGEYTQGAKKTVSVIQKFVDDATKKGEYNAVDKKITWTTYVNYNQDVLNNATITDPIIGNQDYVEGSAKVYEAIIPKNGGEPSKGKEQTDAIVTANKEGVSVKLPNGSEKAYMLVFETSLTDKVITSNYQNVATYKNGLRSTDAPSSIKVEHGGVLASKEGNVDGLNSNYYNWKVDVNPTQSKLENVELIDTPSPNQVIDENSITIYGTNVDKNGTYTKNSGVKLVNGTDYTYKLTTDGITGQQVLTVDFKNPISLTYILEYRSLINSAKDYDDISNKLSMTASNKGVEKVEVSKSENVSVSGGSANGSKASVKIVKLDKNTKERTPLPGAVFELWSITNGKKGTLVRSGETNTDGEIKFGNLRANYDYLLFETKAPQGFTVSESLKNGQKVRFKPDADDNSGLVEELVIENDMPRIQLQKIDEKTKAGLKGAVFAVKNSAGEYYNGINAKYEAQWISDKTKISKETLSALTSAENGNVEVAGLSVGKYTIEELTAPVGYDRLSTTINFEVIDDAGVIRLKDAIQPITNKSFETTSLPVQKIWEDGNNQDNSRPEKLVITLVANGKETDQTLNLTKDNNWKASFTGLRKFDADMNEITYTAKEAVVEGYKSTKPEMKDGVVVFTNSYTPKVINISGKKIWEDKDNQDGERPTAITINLYADEKLVQSKAFEGSDTDSEWSYSFTGLPENKDGKKIDYTVTEDAVDKYTSTQDGFNFTNSYTPGETSVSVTKVWQDGNNQDGIRPENVVVQLFADGKEASEPVTLAEANDWKQTWSNLAVKKAGKAIDYTVKEIGEVKEYTSNVEEVSADNFIVTNTHKPSTINIDGKKVWEDANNQDAIRPETITVNLLAGKEKVASQEVKGSMTDSDWAYSFKDLPEFKAGKKIDYTVTEEKVAKYDTAIDGFTITNSYKPQVTKMLVTKDWEDANNQDGKRVNDIIVELYANGNPTGKKLTLSSAKNWKASFDTLAVKAAGKNIVYTVKELTNVKGYVAKVTSAERKSASDEMDVTVTNSYTPETLSINGEKFWDDNDDQDGKRPENIQINLMANGEKVAEAKVNESTKWKYNFDALPKFEAGVEIKYAVQEVVVDDYSATIDGFNITNKHTPDKTAINVIKDWDDKDNQDGIRSEAITVKLLANGKETDQTLTLSDENNWQADFTDLDVYENKEKINYTIEEIKVDGYESVITGSSEEGFVVTNTHAPEETEVAGAKIWDDADNQDNKRPEEITVNLLANDEVVATKTVTEETNWNYEFKDLPKFKSGEEIVYSVSEEEVADYRATVNGFDITNTHKPEQTSIDVSKVWEDADNQDGLRAKEVVIHLVKNGKETDQTLTLNESNNWKNSFQGLDVYEAGKKIVYTVTEETVDGYKEAVITGSSEEGFVVTNIHEVALKDIKVSKVWDDVDNKDGIRPNSITVKLFANGKDTGKTIVLSGKTNWQGTFKDLAVNENGKEIKYSVKEVAVKGYESKITGDSKKGFVVTNTHIPEKVKVPGKSTPSTPSTSTKTPTNSTGFLPKTGEEQSVLALSLGAILTAIVSVVYIQRRKQN